MFLLLYVAFYFVAADKTVKLLKLDDGGCVGRLGGGNNFDGDEHNYGINDCFWGRDDSYMVTCSDDKTLKLWDVATERCLRTFSGHKGFVFSVQQHAHTGLFVSGAFDNSVRLWDARQQGACWTIDAHADAVVAVDVDNSAGGAGRECVSGSLDGTVRSWDLASARCRSTLHCANIIPVSALSYAPNARFCLVSTLDGYHRLWDVANSSVRDCNPPAPVTPDAASGLVNSNSSNPDNGIVQQYSGHVNRKYNVFSRMFVRGAKSCASDAFVARKRRRDSGGECHSVGDEEPGDLAEADEVPSSGHHSFVCSGSEDGRVYVWDLNGAAGAGGAVLPREVLGTTESPVVAVDCKCAGDDIDGECLLVAGDLTGRMTVWSTLQATC